MVPITAEIIKEYKELYVKESGLGVESDEVFKNNKNIIMKTDNKELFEYSIVSLSNYGYKIIDISLDLQKLENNDNIMTEYEEKYSSKGCKIYMLKAQK